MRQADLPSITVVTITHDRIDSLLTCLRSVASQDYPGNIVHLIVGDASPQLRASEFRFMREFANLSCMHVDIDSAPREFQPVYIPSRLAHLRNIGVAAARTDLICYLDDDNSFETNHVSSLVDVLQKNSADIAFSWRRLQHEDGSDYLEEEYPWVPEARLAVDRSSLSRHIYTQLVDGGVRVPGSAVVRDALFDANGIPVFTVDTNELLFIRRLHETVPNLVWYTWRDMVGDVSDDYEWVRRCHYLGVRFACSEIASVNYTVGGVSNPHSLAVRRTIRTKFAASDG